LPILPAGIWYQPERVLIFCRIQILIAFILILAAGLSFGVTDPNTPKPKPHFEPPKQQVDGMIDRIRQTDPNKAAELRVTINLLQSSSGCPA